uniref:Plasmodium yoelii subtelomeric region (PYST-C1) n=1 Tax=Strongyloides papillosus TaxID=174720 RepID=A0A0N5BGI3_STREA
MNFKFNLSIFVAILVTFAFNCLADSDAFKYVADSELQMRNKRHDLDSNNLSVHNLEKRNCKDKISNRKNKVDFKSKDKGEGFYLNSTSLGDDSD